MQNEITELRYQVKILKRIVYGFGCLLIAGVVVSATSVQTVPDVIQAKKFQVVNDEGKVIVELSNLAAGEVDSGGVDNGMLVTRNSEGQPLVVIGAYKGDGMVLTGRDGIISYVIPLPIGQDSRVGLKTIETLSEDENTSSLP